MKETTIENNALSLFSYEPFQPKVGRIVISHSVLFSSDFKCTLRCSLKKCTLCFVWSRDLDELKHISVRNDIFVREDGSALPSPISVMMLDFQREYLPSSSFNVVPRSPSTTTTR